MLNGKKILFVDDEVDLMNCHKNKFKFRPGFDTVIPFFALNVADAIVIIENENPDLTYLDLRLGKQGSLGSLEILKKYAKNHNIIIATADQDSKDECMALGAKGYLIKPFSFKAMMEEGERILNQSLK
jgi:two-component system chemotaxis response regulator CheY